MDKTGQPSAANSLVIPTDPAPPPKTNEIAGAPKPHRNRPSPLRHANQAAACEYHPRKCVVCAYPDRQMIEDDFLQWRSAWAISHEFKISEASLYRHAHAFDLFPLRRENMRLAPDRIIERGAQTQITGDTVIRAVRAQACLTDDNHWVEPAKHIIVSAVRQPDPPPI